MDASISILTALTVFESTVEHGVMRSVHGYKVVGRKIGIGWVRWERWVERQFILSTSLCREVAVPAAAPRMLSAEWRGRPMYREGQTVGTWRCIVVFDSVAAVAPTSPPPPLLSPFGNPQLKCLPSLYNDLEKVFRFWSVEKVPELINCDSEELSIHSGEQEKASGDADYASESDSDEDPQSGRDLPPPVQKQPRANRKHISTITIVEIAQYFHLPIREASKILKIGVSILKKKCRQYGIPRWPHRKIKSLDSLIHDLEDVLEDKVREDVEMQKEKEKVAAATAIKALKRRKRMLETEKEAIQQRRALDLMTETKLFREDVFKRRYRAKNAASD